MLNKINKMYDKLVNVICKTEQNETKQNELYLQQQVVGSDNKEKFEDLNKLREQDYGNKNSTFSFGLNPRVSTSESSSSSFRVTVLE